jgi:hypothetical protein
MSGQSNWIIPAITAAASLLGAMVGAIAYCHLLDIEEGHERESRRQEREWADQKERQQSTLLREAAIRFVATMTDISVASIGLTQISREWGEVAGKLANARTEQELAEVAQEFDPTIEPGVGQLDILFRLVRTTGLFEEDVKKAMSLLTEPRLIAPGDVADSAQRLIYTGFAHELAVAMAPNLRHQTIEAFNREINEFVNRVRGHMNVEPYAFNAIDEQGVRELPSFPGAGR